MQFFILLVCDPVFRLVVVCEVLVGLIGVSVLFSTRVVLPASVLVIGADVEDALVGSVVLLMIVVVIGSKT